jgi:uncharacterized protein YcfJ
MLIKSAPRLGPGIVLAAGLAAALTLAVPALADGEIGSYDRWDGAEVDYADVVNVEPNLRQVRVSVPRQECYTDTRYVPDDEESGYRRDRPNPAPMIVGGLIGAVIGHQLGEGGERGVGTVAGAIIGGAVGHSVAQRQAAEYGRDFGGDRPLRAIDSQRCETRYDQHYESRIDSYRVSYRYNGHLYHTTLPRDPGRQLRVRVAVTPLD